MKFTEAKLEQAFIELLENEDFPHCLGNTISRADDEVLIEEDLKNYLLNRYKEEQLTEIEAQSIIIQLKTFSSADLYESNKKIMRWLADGFILEREDRQQKDIHIELIDYSGLDAQRKNNDLDNVIADPPVKYGKNHNIYKFVNQLEIVGTEKRIPDGIIYINGLPIVVFEFKSAIREEATIHNAYEQLTIRYKRDIPELFKYNAFCVISDGVNNKAGSFFAPYEFYYAWRRIAGLAKDVDGIDSMFTLVQGMLHQNRLRDIIQNFIYIPDSSKINTVIRQLKEMKFIKTFLNKRRILKRIKNNEMKSNAKSHTHCQVAQQFLHNCGSYTSFALTLKYPSRKFHFFYFI